MMLTLLLTMQNGYIPGNTYSIGSSYRQISKVIECVMTMHIEGNYTLTYDPTSPSRSNALSLTVSVEKDLIQSYIFTLLFSSTPAYEGGSSRKICSKTCKESGIC